MKIHRNKQIQEMLANGEAQIVDYKYVPYWHVHLLNNNQDTPAATPTAAFVTKLINEQQALETVLTELAQQAPDPAPAEAVQQVSEPIPTEPALQAPEPISAEPALQAPEPISAEPALQMPEPLPVESVQQVPKAGVSVHVIQQESAPGGLIAEVHFEGAASELAFETLLSSEMVSSDQEILEDYEYTPEDNIDEDPSYPPYVSFICFNRLGLTIKNLTNLLESEEDFELNIIDCNSQDNSWDYIQSLTDNRIKSRIRFDTNCGPIYAVNFALSRRKPFQYFITIDSDTFIKTKNWIARFMEVFNAFPEVGLLGLMRDNPYPRYLPPIVPRISGSISYLELKNADINAQMDFIPGQLQCLRPRLIKEIGYWSEENGFGDAELSPRIVHFTDFTAGFITTIEIDMTQSITCEECLGKNFCTLNRSICDCFSMSRRQNKNESFVNKNLWKFQKSFDQLRTGERTAYCASIHDPESRRTHQYNAEWAYENFNHYIVNGN